MLSYQHIYHAGNLADVHKHMLTAWSLSYLIRKDKPISYIETHAGRGLYDLSRSESLKTGEASQGISKVLSHISETHPYALTISRVKAQHGSQFYPGSPVIAATLLREQDKIQLAEMHPQEFDALRYAMSGYGAKCYQQDGFNLAHSLCPPSPKRGFMLIDPSYENKEDYINIPKHVSKLSKVWNVGGIAIWYPVLKSAAHGDMLSVLERNHEVSFRHEVTFPPAKETHGMVGSGMFFVNPPFGLENEAARVTDLFNGSAIRRTQS